MKNETINKWVGITGTWRLVNADVERDVRDSVKELLSSGGGIVTGGAMGVDYFAVDEALKIDPTGKRIKVVLPSTLENYSAHIKRWAEGYSSAGDADITAEDGHRLISQLEKLKSANPSAILETPNVSAGGISQEAYYARNTTIVELSKEIYAFQVNQSKGTQDTIDKAIERKIPVSIHKKYVI